MIRRLASKHIVRTAFLLVVLWLAVGFIAYPMLRTIGTSLSVGDSWGISGYADFFSDPQNRTAIANTIAVGITSVITCGLLGTFLAVYMRFFCRHCRRLMQILLMSPMMIPGVIIVIAFMQLYGESGFATTFAKTVLGFDDAPFSFGGFGGIVFVITYTQYVYFYLNMYTALQHVDKSVVEAVRGFGGNTMRVIKDAIFPAVRPALIISVMTTFVSAIGSYSAPALIGGSFRVLSTQIVMAKANYDMVLTSIDVTVLLALGTIVTAVFYRLSKRYAYSVSTRAEFYQPDRSGHKAARVIFSIFAILQITVVLLPVAVVFYLSFMTPQSIMTELVPTGFTLDNYLQIFGNARKLQPLQNSLEMALIAAVAAMVITVPIAYFARRSSSRLAHAGELLAMLPWCMPASVIAIDLINVFNQPSIFSLGKSLVGTFEILPIAYTIVALPLLLNSSRIALDGLGENTEEASRSLGAGWLRSFATVVVPNIASGVLAGAILVFVRTMGEYTMSALLYGVYNRPISVSVVTAMQEYQIGTSVAYGSVVILVCCVLLFVILKLDSRRFAVEPSSKT